MRIETYMKIEEIANDGRYWIGTCDDQAIQGDYHFPDEFDYSNEDQSFGINSCDEYSVVDGIWEEKPEFEVNPTR